MAFIPPGGMAGFSQMTPASRLALTQGATRSSPTRRTRRKSTRRAKAAKRRAAPRAKRSRKMKFGSPAWQKKYRVGKFAKK